MHTHIIATTLALLGARLALAATSDDGKAYDGARRTYYALKANAGKGDAGKGQGREAWKNAATRFEQVAKALPRERRRRRWRSILPPSYAISSRESRWRPPIGRRRPRGRTMSRIRAALYRGSQLADDALYQIARIALDRENDPGGARAALTDLLARYPRGDMAPRARKLLASVPEPRARPKAPPASPSVERPTQQLASSVPSQPRRCKTPALQLRRAGPSPRPLQDEPPATTKRTTNKVLPMSMRRCETESEALNAERA